MKNKSVKFVLLSLLVCGQSLAAPVWEEKFDIRGYIKDIDNGERLPYANISLLGTTYGTASNTDGYFVLVNIPAELCTLRVDYIGYESVLVPVTPAKDLGTLEILLEQQTLEMEGVVVTAENMQTMQVSHKAGEVRMSPRQIKALPSIGEVDIFRSLQLLPGISAVNDGSSGLYVRGGTPDQNLVLFDGMTIYNVDHFFGFISAFNAEAVKDVRVFKGGFPAKFGGRTSSVVELTGKSGSFENFQAGGRLNLLSGSAVFAVPVSGRGSWLTSFRRSHTDVLKSGLYDKIFKSVSGQNNGEPEEETQQTGQGGFGGGQRFQQPQNEEVLPDFYYYDLNSKLTYAVTENDVFSLSFYNGQDKLDESQNLGNLTFGGQSQFGAGTTGSASIEDRTRWGNLGASAKWSRVWSSRIYSNFLVAYSDYFSESSTGFSATLGSENTTRRAFSSNEDNNVKDVTMRIDNEWQLSKSHKIEVGAWYSRTFVDLLFTANDTLNILDRDDEATQASVYLQDQWRVFEPLELTFGVRATDYDLTGKTYYEPRASFELAVTNRLQLKGAWGEYHQFINRVTNENVLEGNRDFWLLADDQLDPAFSEHRILGLKYETSQYLFDIEAYHKDLDGVSEFSQRFRRGPNTVSQDLFFLGTGVSKGMEFLVQKKSGRLNGWLSYTLAKVEYNFDIFNNGAAFPADQDRRHEFKAVANYNLGKWRLSSTWAYASGSPFTSPENQYAITLLDGQVRSYIHVGGKNANRLPAYHRLDVSFSREFHSTGFDWDFGISVFNLYDHKNVWYREYVLDTSPIIVRDVTTLGVTPTLTLGIKLN